MNITTSGATAEKNIDDVNIVSERPLPTPLEIRSQAQRSATSETTVIGTRSLIKNVLDRTDPRLFLIVGPCSIHDPKAAFEYAQRLKTLAEKVSDTFILVMRVYFEKPRTVVGWKGFINDPFLDNSFHIEQGLLKARQLLLQISELGLGVGTEALDPVTPQYIQDLISWTAIGARTTESQTHREIASGLSCPVGFKNATDGNIDVAINALKAVSKAQHFLGINLNGQSTVLQTRGNAWAHIVLRGGIRPNYDSVNIALCERALEQAKLRMNIVVDCSHANSSKDPALQPLVLRDCTNQILEGNTSIVGFMLESNLFPGRQDLGTDPSGLRYGVSVTDGCLGWEETESVILETRSRISGMIASRV